jgi:hypothetical protein
VIKALDWMVSGIINNYLKSKTHYANTIPQFKEYGIPLSKEIMDCIREDIRCIDFPKGFIPPGRSKSKIFTRENDLSDKLSSGEKRKFRPLDLMKKHLY